MKLPLSLLQFSLLALAQASPFTQPLQARASGLQFGPCQIGYNFTLPIECSSLPVPLDYTNTSAGTINLEIMRLKSNSTKPRGSIFLNFGGPGDDGRASFDFLGEIMQSMTGGCYDMITVVPRGTNNTLLFDCYASDTARALAPVAPAGNASDTAIDTIWADATVFDATCAVNQNETGQFVGTAFTARDIMAVVDALGEDGMVRYWGISYGTLLGATLAAMFPDKVDKVLLDGVVNAHEYYQNNEVQLYHDTDKVFDQMLAECAAQPTLCPLAQGRNATTLQKDMYAFLEDLKFNPIPIFLPTGDGTVVDYSTARTLLSSSLDSPGGWATITQLFYDVITGNGTGVYLDLTSSSASSLGADSQFGIKCGDVLTHTTNKTDILPVLEARHKASKVAGDTADPVVANCAQWLLPAKERYSGNFSVKTHSPLMFIGNTADNVTPLVSAQNMSAGFSGSVVLEHGGYGHSSVLTQASLCTAQAVRAYFTDGTLPKVGAKCAIEKEAFGETGWAELLLANPATCPN